MNKSIATGIMNINYINYEYTQRIYIRNNDVKSIHKNLIY